MQRTWMALLVLVSACGDGSSVAADADIGVPEFRIENVDDSGFVHGVTFRCLDLVADTPQSFVSDGPHQHTLRLEVAQMQSILAGELVELIFTDGHEHSFPIQKPEDACVGLGDAG